MCRGIRPPTEFEVYQTIWERTKCLDGPEGPEASASGALVVEPQLRPLSHARQMTEKLLAVLLEAALLLRALAGAGHGLAAGGGLAGDTLLVRPARLDAGVLLHPGR